MVTAAKRVPRGVERMPRAFGQVLSERKLWRVLPTPRFARPDGPPRIALSFDLDYQADTDVLGPLCDLLSEREILATMFSIGALVERDPALYRAAAERGHEIANHTQTHPDNPVLNPDNEFWDLDAAAMRKEIGRAQDVLERETRQRPTGFRAPHFKDAPPLRKALSAFPEITYVSSSLSTRCPRPVPFFPGRDEDRGRMMLNFPATERASSDLLMIPLTACPGVRWSPFSSYLSIRRPANPGKGAGLHDVPTFQRLWADMLRRDRRLGFVSVYFDPLDVMRDEETRIAFAAMLDHALAEGWAVGTLKDTERAWRPIAEAEYAGGAS